MLGCVALTHPPPCALVPPPDPNHKPERPALPHIEREALHQRSCHGNGAIEQHKKCFGRGRRGRRLRMRERLRRRRTCRYNSCSFESCANVHKNIFLQMLAENSSLTIVVIFWLKARGRPKQGGLENTWSSKCNK